MYAYNSNANNITSEYHWQQNGCKSQRQRI